MGLGNRMRRLAPSRVCFALAIVAAAGGAAVASEAGGLNLRQQPPRFPDLPAVPLIETLRAPRATDLPSADFRSVDLSPLGRVAKSKTAIAGPAPVDAASDWSPAPVVVKAPASAPPDPVPNAIAAALTRFILRDDRSNPLGDGDWGAAKAAIGAFYADRGFRPVWVDGDGLTPAGRAATTQLARSDDDGLSLAGLALPRRLVAPLDPEALAAAEVAIAAAVVAYAEQASGSRVTPSRVSAIVSARPEVADPGEALAETAAAADPGARLADFNPPHKGYRALREALRRVNEAAEGRAPRPTRAVLALAGAVTDALAFGDDPLIDPAAKTSAAPARRRVNLASIAPSGARGGDASRQRAAILASMEMWRWEPRDMGERRIEVNIPDYSVAVVDGDEVVMTSRVVVGKPDTPTPVFSDLMRYVLINPSWQVPDSIIKKEILPRLDHFTRLGYEVKTIGGRTVVRQPPGEGNALGRLAFMFPNDHSVYLHDTPARRLFAEDKRALSHGCVRVENPKRLAELVLGWPEARVEMAIGGKERTVFLPQPLPIHIEYFTEFVGADGILEERPDVYGITQRLARILSTSRQD